MWRGHWACVLVQLRVVNCLNFTLLVDLFWGGFLVVLLFAGLLVVPILESESGAAGGGAKRSVTATAGHFLPLALLANFATFFAIGLVRALFPKLAIDLGFSPSLLGYLLALIAVTQLAVFYFMSRTDRWQFRMSPIIFAQLLAAFGLGLIGIGTQPIIFACGFLLLGGLIGVTFTASIFYSLYAEGPGGRRTGIHEAIVGSGFLFGPSSRRSCCRAFQCTICPI